jgi:hypothetical protein
LRQSNKGSLNFRELALLKKQRERERERCLLLRWLMLANTQVSFIIGKVVASLLTSIRLELLTFVRLRSCNHCGRRRELLRSRLGDLVAAAMAGSRLLPAGCISEQAVTLAVREICTHSSCHENSQ